MKVLQPFRLAAAHLAQAWASAHNLDMRVSARALRAERRKRTSIGEEAKSGRVVDNALDGSSSEAGSDASSENSEGIDPGDI